MATLADLKSDLCDLLADTTDDRWSTTTKKRALNQAYKKLASRIRIPSLKSVWTISWTSNTASNLLSAALPATTIRVVKSVYWGAKKPENKLSPLTEEQWDELDQTTTADKPIAYYVMNKTIYLWPIPTSSATVNINGWRSIALLASDTDEPLIPEDFHDYIPFGAAYKLLLMDKNPEDIPMAREYRSEFREGFEDIVAFHEEIGVEDDRPDQVFDNFDSDSDDFGNL